MILALGALPLQAGVGISQAEAEAEHIDFGAMLLRIAAHNAKGLNRGEYPAIEKLFAARVNEADFQGALTQFAQLQAQALQTPQLQDSHLLDALILISSVYALKPELRPRIERFLIAGSQDESCREINMYLILRAGILSPHNQALAETLFDKLPFSLSRFKAHIKAYYEHDPLYRAQCDQASAGWRAGEGRESLIPAQLYHHAQEELIRACLDIQSARIIQRLMEHQALTQETLSATSKKYFSIKVLHLDAGGAIAEEHFWTNNFFLLWPSQEFISALRLYRKHK